MVSANRTDGFASFKSCLRPIPVSIFLATLLLNCVSIASFGQLTSTLTDQCLGQSWQLVPKTTSPGGPGRWVLVSASEKGNLVSRKVKIQIAAANWVVRPGDHILIEQNLPLIHAVFEAVALEQAEVGHQLWVRLDYGRNSRPFPGETRIRVLVREKGVFEWLSREGGAK